MLRLVIVCVAALGVLQVTACCGTPCPPPPERTLSIGCVESKDALRLDRGDWQVSRRTAVWKVLASRPDSPPVLVGYVTQRKYRQLRGGPEYAIYEVSRLNREVQRLRGASQSQGAAINRLGRQSGATPPQFYQNYGGYYPGIPR